MKQTSEREREREREIIQKQYALTLNFSTKNVYMTTTSKEKRAEVF
jgi:hypothetical protein